MTRHHLAAEVSELHLMVVCIGQLHRWCRRRYALHPVLDTPVKNLPSRMAETMAQCLSRAPLLALTETEPGPLMQYTIDLSARRTF